MKKYFTFSDGLSDKFWYIETNGNALTIIQGKINTAGKTQNKTYLTNELCEKEADKLILEKLKKEYQEQTAYTLIEEKICDTESTRNKSILLKPDRGILPQDLRNFIKAIENENIEDILKYLSAGVEPNNEIETQHGSVHSYGVVLATGNIELIRLFTPLITSDTISLNRAFISNIPKKSINTVLKTMIDSGYNFASDPNVTQILPRTGIDIAKYLIEVCNINIRENDQLLLKALEYKNRPLVDYLLDNGSPVNGVGIFSGLPVMHLALEIYGIDLEFIKRLVSKGANPGAISKGEYRRQGLTIGGGETAIEYAAKYMSPEVAEYLGNVDDYEIPIEAAFHAARFDQKKLLERYIDKYDINVCDELGRTLLHFACMAEGEYLAVDNILLLINKGIDVNAKDKMGRNAFFYLNFESTGLYTTCTVEQFLDTSTIYNEVLSQTKSPLWEKLRNTCEHQKKWFEGRSGDRYYVGLILLKAGLELECADVKGLTPIMFHARYRPGDDTDETFGETTEGREHLSLESLMGTVAGGDDVYMVRYNAFYNLLRCMPELNNRYPDNGATVLHFVQNVKIFEKEEIQQLMFKLGADANIQDNNGRTALHYAAACNESENFMDIESRDSIECLILHGNANPNIQDNEGNTPLHLAVKSKNASWTVDQLLTNGADATIPNNKGETVEDIMKLLGIQDRYIDKIKKNIAKSKKPQGIEIKWQSVETGDSKGNVALNGLTLHAAKAMKQYDIEDITTLDNNCILTIGLHDQVNCIDSLTGDVLWTSEKYRIKSPTPYNNLIYCGIDDIYNMFFASLDAATGKVKDRLRLNCKISSSISIYKYKSILSTKTCALFYGGNTLFSVDVDKMSINWKMEFDEGDKLTCNPQVFNGYCLLAYFENKDYKLRKINLKNGEIEKEIEIKHEDAYGYVRKMVVISNQVWVNDGFRLCSVDMITEKPLTNVFDFDDDSRWYDYDTLNIFGWNNKLYIYVKLTPKDRDDKTEYYRLCEINGSKANTLADFNENGLGKLHHDNIFIINRQAQKLSKYKLTEKQLVEWEFPNLSGDDNVEDCLHASNGYVYVSQCGGNDHQDCDLLYVLR